MNGHKNWNHWNVALWINNDEGLYRAVKRYAQRYGKAEGARLLMRDYFENQSTPDGAPYSYSSVRAALREI